jgi:hypothetical protein
MYALIMQIQNGAESPTPGTSHTFNRSYDYYPSLTRIMATTTSVRPGCPRTHQFSTPDILETSLFSPFEFIYSPLALWLILLERLGKKSLNSR